MLSVRKKNHLAEFNSKSMLPMHRLKLTETHRCLHHACQNQMNAGGTLLLSNLAKSTMTAGRQTYKQNQSVDWDCSRCMCMNADSYTQSVQAYRLLGYCSIPVNGIMFWKEDINASKAYQPCSFQEFGTLLLFMFVCYLSHLPWSRQSISWHSAALAYPLNYMDPVLLCAALEPNEWTVNKWTTGKEIK